MEWKVPKTSKKEKKKQKKEHSKIRREKKTLKDFFPLFFVASLGKSIDTRRKGNEMKTKEKKLSKSDFPLECKKKNCLFTLNNVQIKEGT